MSEKNLLAIFLYHNSTKSLNSQYYDGSLFQFKLIPSLFLNSPCD